MKIELRAIDDTNRHAILRLEPSDDQKQFIASNRTSLDTALKTEYRNIARPFAIYADGLPVGFVMFAFDRTGSQPEYWLWRFMIDHDLQGKGFGSAALHTIIEYFRQNGADHILLSTKETNRTALALYHKFHFTETGEMNDGEIVLRLDL